MLIPQQMQYRQSSLNTMLSTDTVGRIMKIRMDFQPKIVNSFELHVQKDNGSDDP
jgi:hypothetical protein